MPKIKLDKDKREMLGRRLQSYIQDAAREIEGMLGTWDVLAKASRNQPIGGELDLGTYNQCLPLIQPRIGQLVGYICGPMFAIRPWFAAVSTGSDGQRVEEVENGVQFALDLTKAPQKGRKAVKMSAIAEPSVLCVHWSSDERGPMPELEVVHPENFSIYPLSSGDVRNCIWCGRRRMLRYGDILDSQDDGEYFEGEVRPSPRTGKRIAVDETWAGTQEDTVEDERHKLVETYEGYVRDRDVFGDADWKRVLVVPETGLLLFAEPHAAEVTAEELETDPVSGLVTGVVKTRLEQYERPPYFPLRLQPQEDDEFYHATPFARYAIDVQRAYNSAWSLFYAGTAMQAFGAGFVQGRLPGQSIRFQAGNLYEVDTPIQIQWAHVSFRGDHFPQILGELKGMADAALRISQIGISQQLKSGTTATEASGLMQAQTQGLDEYREVAGTAWLEMADYVRKLIYIHWDEFKEYWGGAFPAENREAFKMPCVWELVGKTEEANPMVMLQKIQQLAGNFPGLQNNPEMAKAVLDVLNLPINNAAIKAAIDQQAAMPPAQPGATNGQQGLQADPAMASIASLLGGG